MGSKRLAECCVNELFRLGYFRFSAILLAGGVLLSSAGCLRDRTPKVLEVAYVRGGGAPLRDQLGSSSSQVTTLPAGERVEILAKRARWFQVRQGSGHTGWVHSRFLVSTMLYDQFQRLAEEAAALPSQGKAKVQREAALHVEAGRSTDTFYSLQEGDEVEVLAHRLAERTDRPGAGGIASPGEAGSAEPGSAEVEVKGFEDWFLVRASGDRAGWLREGQLDISPPLEIARYSEGLRIRGWFVLYQEQEKGEVHPWYLWTTVHPRAGLPFDYDEIRVFVWDPRASRYETSYRERNLIGFYPVQVGSRETAAGPVPTFSLQLEDEKGRRFQKKYAMHGRLVRPES
jgi:hypothetical protein